MKAPAFSIAGAALGALAVWAAMVHNYLLSGATIIVLICVFFAAFVIEVYNRFFAEPIAWESDFEAPASCGELWDDGRPCEARTMVHKCVMKGPHTAHVCGFCYIEKTVEVANAS